jgi:hypothetical protein
MAKFKIQNKSKIQMSNFKTKVLSFGIGYASSTVGKFFLYISTGWPYVFIGRAIDRFGKGI